jgi:EPSP synthase (3-phosphoshikimate 1-carboxyvinyltransferase)
VQPIKKISGEVRLPGSKSLSNRALLLAALAEGTTVVENLLVRQLSLAPALHCSLLPERAAGCGES